MLSLLAALAAAQLASANIAPFPPANQLYLGAWTNGQEGYSDTPAALNARMNLSFPAFQLGQRIPLAPYDYVVGTGWPAFNYLIDYTNTNAGYFLTVYPDDGMANVTDADLVALGTQIKSYQDSGRTVWLRYAPEMQGTWFAYGHAPTEYVREWRRMYQVIHEIAPDTTIIWSPNFSYGYPYSQGLDGLSAEDTAALDTNGNGVLDAGDDAYAPYYPGDLFVDAAGVSVYYKGPDRANRNAPQPGGFCEDMMEGIDPYRADRYTPFYSTYCTNHPCVISEGAAAYHVDILGGSSQEEVQLAWSRDCITNTTFHDLYPELKMIIMYEHEKAEESYNGFDLRDFRLTNSTSIATAFKADLDAMDRYVWAEPLEQYPGVQTDLPTENPRLVTTALQTATVLALSGEVTWTQTEYSTPIPPGVSTVVPLSATDSVLGAAPTASAPINAVDNESSAVTFSLSATLGLICLALYTL